MAVNFASNVARRNATHGAPTTQMSTAIQQHTGFEISNLYLKEERGIRHRFSPTQRAASNGRKMKTRKCVHECGNAGMRARAHPDFINEKSLILVFWVMTQLSRCEFIIVIIFPEILRVFFTCFYMDFCRWRKRSARQSVRRLLGHRFRLIHNFRVVFP